MKHPQATPPKKTDKQRITDLERLLVAQTAAIDKLAEAWAFETRKGLALKAVVFAVLLDVKGRRVASSSGSASSVTALPDSARLPISVSRIVERLRVIRDGSFEDLPADARPVAEIDELIQRITHAPADYAAAVDAVLEQKEPPT